LIARALAIGVLAVAVAVVAVVLLGGNGGHRYHMEFQTAGQLVTDDDVQVGGRRIGSIKDISLTDDNLARIEVEVQEPFAPLHEGTKGVIRHTSLSGVANRYVALTLGPQSAPELDDDAVLGTDSTTTIVDLDQLFNTLDESTRNDLRDVVRGFATASDGRGDEGAEAAEYFNPALSSTRRLLEEVTEDEGTLTRFLVNSSQAVSALADRRDDIAGLVGNTDTTAQAIAAESASLDRALAVLPTTIRRANSTFVNLRATLDDLDPLVDESKPATRRLAPLLRELRPLVADSRPTIRDLRRLVTRPGANNDLIDATRKMPPLARAARPAVTASTRALARLQPVLEFTRPYTPEVVGWLRDFGQGASNYDANGHFARVQPIFNAFSFDENPAGGTLTEIPPSARLDNLDLGNLRRCPGAATQVRPDGSNNRQPDGLDCDPEHAPPGP